MPKNKGVSIPAKVDADQARDIAQASYNRGFRDGVMHSAVIFKTLFKRIQRASSITELQIILRELDDIGTPVVGSGKDRSQPPKSGKEDGGR